MSWVGVAVGGSALIGSVIAANASKSAAQTQANAATNSQNIQQQMFDKMYSGQTPFMQGGYGALSQLEYGLGTGPQSAGQASVGGGGPFESNLDASGGAQGGSGVPGSSPQGYGSLLQPFTAQTMQQYSPAYQFQREQGMQGTLNGIAPGQGALSGAAQQALVGFNQNFSNTAFSNAFNQYQTQQGNIYGRLAGLAQLGQGAASNEATGASTFAGGIGQSAQNVGTALAGGQVGSANAITGGVGALGTLPFLYQKGTATPSDATTYEGSLVGG